jgi:hypothetical protein
MDVEAVVNRQSSHLWLEEVCDELVIVGEDLLSRSKARRH